jgi:hypothetical protein
MPRPTAVAASRYLAGSLLSTRPTMSRRSCGQYTPSQAAYLHVSLPLTKAERLFSLLPHNLLCLFSGPCFARSPHPALPVVQVFDVGSLVFPRVSPTRPRACLCSRVPPSVLCESVRSMSYCRFRAVYVPLEFPLFFVSGDSPTTPHRTPFI